MKKNLLLALFIICFWTLPAGVMAAPSALYLTWLHDPSSTMTIRWQAQGQALKSEKGSIIYYQEKGDETWLCEEGRSLDLSGSKIAVHTVELTDLKEDTDYAFRVGGDKKIYYFRTLPQTLPTTPNRQMRFVVGGDAFSSSHLFRKMNEQIAMQDPDFIVLGGDIAYTVGREGWFRKRGRAWQIKRWQAFFKGWMDEMVTSDGRLIPLLIVVGNHDVDCKAKKCPPDTLFFELFALPEGKSYRAFDAGSYLSLFVLDTGHSAPMGGEQVQWLESALKERSGVPYQLAAYHVAAYPSVYKYNSKGPASVRRLFCPLLERYKVQGAFEHHNHAFKRTHPILNEKINPSGVVYFGDGSWGVSPRKTVSLDKTWYLAKVAKTNCYWLVTLTEQQGVVEAFDLKGVSLDRVTIQPLRTEPVLAPSSKKELTAGEEGAHDFSRSGDEGSQG